MNSMVFTLLLLVTSTKAAHPVCDNPGNPIIDFILGPDFFEGTSIKERYVAFTNAASGLYAIPFNFVEIDGHTATDVNTEKIFRRTDVLPDVPKDQMSSRQMMGTFFDRNRETLFLHSPYQEAVGAKTVYFTTYKKRPINASSPAISVQKQGTEDIPFDGDVITGVNVCRGACDPALYIRSLVGGEANIRTIVPVKFAGDGAKTNDKKYLAIFGGAFSYVTKEDLESISLHKEDYNDVYDRILKKLKPTRKLLCVDKMETQKAHSNKFASQKGIWIAGIIVCVLVVVGVIAWGCKKDKKTEEDSQSPTRSDVTA